MELFRVRLNCVDHYQAVASDFDPQLRPRTGSNSKNEPKVPVIRVFGATETGQKVCAHIHGAFPYLYIEYAGGLGQSEVKAYVNRLRLSIDHALAVTYRRNIYDGNISFVAHISLVKGVPFYGYHVGYKYFLKIYIYNPLHMTRLADLLRQGTILKSVFQPYESHLQYLLQWMCDYNLYGCGYLDCEKLKFRSPVPSYEDMDSMMHLWHDRSIPSESISDESRFLKQSHCSIEVDICVQNILNRNAIKPRPIHHEFMEESKAPSSDEKLVYSMAGLWRDETRRRKAAMADTDLDSSPFPPEVMVTMSAEPRNTQKGGWIHEQEFNDRVDVLIKQEKIGQGIDRVSSTTVFPAVADDASVRTVIESVEDLFPENLPLTATNYDYDDDTLAEADSIDIDESKIPNLDEAELAESLDAEMGPNYIVQARNYQHTKAPIEKLHTRRNDKSRAYGNHHHGTFSAPSNAPAGGKAIGSGELGAYGVHPIHETGDLDHDSFEIDEEFSSNISLPSIISKRRLTTETNDRATEKRRRLMQFEGTSADEQTTNGVSDLETDGQAPGSRDMATQEVTKNGDPTVLSQESIKENTFKRKKSLAFAVVKDPNSPDTIMRLSQRSSSSHQTEVFEDSQFKQKMSQDTIAKSSSSRHESVSNIKYTQDLESRIHYCFNVLDTVKTWVSAERAPKSSFVSATLLASGRPSVIYQEAHYSDDRDIPELPREYAGREFRIEGKSTAFLPDFDSSGCSPSAYGDKFSIGRDKSGDDHLFSKRRRLCGLRHWQYGQNPPSRSHVERWLGKQSRSDSYESQASEKRRYIGPQRTRVLSQIDGPTQKNSHESKFSQQKKTTSVQHEAQYMSIMSLEVHVDTNGSLMPNPEQNEIKSIFWCIRSDDEALDTSPTNDGTYVGVLALSEDDDLAIKISRQAAVHVEIENTELDLINRMIDIVRLFDPDILTGYEVHGSSWGYLIERARYKYEFNLCDEFSRMRSQSHGRFGKEADRWGFTHTSTIRVTGRHMINIWRAMRGELNLLQYTMENVVFHLLHRRIPHYSHADLTKWYNSNKPRDLAKVINYYISRVQLDLEILEHNELIPRTSEQARLLGVDFFSVFSRGSQYKVESLMFRIAKPENFLLVSPSRKQVGQQNALECLPLVMEPQSAFYNSPLLVLDFQSLYPSIMIAYNYCYSTCLGRVTEWRGRNKMGFTDYERPPGLLELLKDQVNFAPNGLLYVKPEVRKSLLAKMLSEILETRVMVKSGMKQDKDDNILQQLLNNRQLALKLIANVTYGYTSASFSGRMPCSEIADSIVQTARETLEKAIALIHSVKRWGAEVVYGDTDSLFVYLKGRTKDEAFDIGNEIAKAVTQMNPRPVKLKFEKVYFPCVLLAKKRYVGFKYESKTQVEPEFDAKGIETVRRDGTPAEQKIEEKALKILFRTADLSQVKSYFQDQCRKIMQGKVSVQDFCFAKEVKLGTYSDKGLPPPGALISTKRMLEDPRAEPQYGERVPYVVITGAPGARLIDRCVAPETLLQNEFHELDADYYIMKNIIPPLERIFNLVGANVRQWYDEMPKYQRIRRVEGPSLNLGAEDMVVRKTLESYMKSSSCLVCRQRLEDSELPICSDCMQQQDMSSLVLRNRLLEAEKKFVEIEKICRSCASLPWGEEVRCDSKDCPIFYSRSRQRTSLRSVRAEIEPTLRGLENLNEQLYDW